MPHNATALRKSSTRRRVPALFVLWLLGCLSLSLPAGSPVEIRVDASKPGHRLSRLLTGACIEDVNHEIYGGIYSQMIFGESFQEPAPSVPPRGFRAFGGEWRLENGELHGSAGDGPKLQGDVRDFADGSAGVEVDFADNHAGNSGLLVRLANAGAGADNFDGYEISLDPANQTLILGRHHHNWTLLKTVPCEVPVGGWIALEVRMKGRTIEVLVNGKGRLEHEDTADPLAPGGVGLRQWQREASYRNLWVRTGAQPVKLPFEPGTTEPSEVSGMWRLSTSGSARGRCALETRDPFVGAQSQRIAFESGEGAFGIENQGLNRRGLAFPAAQPHEVSLWARAESETEIWATLESPDGSRVHGETRITVPPGGWQHVAFTLTAATAEPRGRFAIRLRRPGSVTLGYVRLEPGEWGRFKGLSVRRDIAEALIDQGITVLRYGGSMVNHPEYRWKKMIGPRDRRPPYHGTWYPHSTNGWGIVDFMSFCEAAGFEYIPAFNMGETPADLADFIEYAKGSRESTWGRRRVEDGHPEPYKLCYVELGNEERVDEKYAQAFEALAAAIWATDPGIIPVVGDFVYSNPIHDPHNVTGSAAGLTNLQGQERILRFAKQQGHDVWFDLHVGTDGPRPDSTLEATLSFVDALDKLARGARHKVVVFELNSGNHAHRRGLANAIATQTIERDGRIPIVTSANCLQPDSQNDNGWDQGLLFLSPSKVWLQSPGWVTRIISRSYQPIHVPVSVSGSTVLDVTARRAEDARALVLGVVNVSSEPVEARIVLEGFRPASPTATFEELSGPLAATNTAEEPTLIAPRASTWQHGLAGPSASPFTFRPLSFTVIRLE